MSNTIRLPESFSEYKGEELMSNYDNEIVSETLEAIKGQELFSRYSGWDFNGKVWWQNDRWHCEVWCYGSWKETFTCHTLENIMMEVSDVYGYE